jgi:hypothetical protein
MSILQTELTGQNNSKIAKMVSFICQGMATSVCTKDVICTDNAQQIFGGKM